MVRSAVLAACFMFAALACASSGPTTDDFRQALDAARNDDWETLSKQERRLGEAHPLRAYLEFHRLRAGLPDVSPRRVNAYRERYPDSPLPKDIRELALVAYAKEERWADIRSLHDTAPTALELRCHYWHAHLEGGDRGEALDQARQIWLAGRSRPASCDALFDAARDERVIGQEEILQRMELAFHQGATGLINHLEPMLEGQWANVGKWLPRLYRDPERVEDLPDDLSREHRALLASAALRRLADTDTEVARRRLEEDADALGLDQPAQRQEVAARIAWFAVIRDQPENRDWLDRWLTDNGSQSLLDQRARRAVIEQDWQALPDWVARLPESERNDSRWLYWLGRAAQANDDPEQARRHWQAAAQQRNFYGFLAVDRLAQDFDVQRDYHLGNQVAASDDSLPQDGALERVRLLRAIDEPGLAWNEWNWLVLRSQPDKVRRMAQYALDNAWYDLAVQASIRAQAWNTLAWRFPPAHRDLFNQAGREYGIDPWLAMAIARRESAFYPNARSPVGALGLMQLMPGTAAKVARDADQSPPSQRQVRDIGINIELGTRYLEELLERFGDNRVLALAAYNAGPNRVENWLADEDEAVPADVWIESIPFRETRDYVQAVLAYRVLLQHLHGASGETVRLMLPAERSTPYSVVMLED